MVLGKKKGVNSGNLENGILRSRRGDNKKKEAKLSKMDKKDIRIIGALISGLDNRRISTEFGIPLSTVQRRARVIVQSGLLQLNYKPNYTRLGLKKGMVHIYLNNGNLKPTAEKISAMEGITSVSIHIGNSDIVGDFVYQDSEQIIDIVSSIKKLDGVEKAVWSEEVYVLPVNQANVAAPYNRLLRGG